MMNYMEYLHSVFFKLLLLLMFVIILLAKC